MNFSLLRSFAFFSAFNKRETTHRLDWPDTEQWQMKINLLIPDQNSANVSFHLTEVVNSGEIDGIK